MRGHPLLAPSSLGYYGASGFRLRQENTTLTSGRYDTVREPRRGQQIPRVPTGVCRTGREQLGSVNGVHWDLPCASLQYGYRMRRMNQPMGRAWWQMLHSHIHMQAPRMHPSLWYKRCHGSFYTYCHKNRGVTIANGKASVDTCPQLHITAHFIGWPFSAASQRYHISCYISSRSSASAIRTTCVGSVSLPRCAYANLA